MKLPRTTALLCLVLTSLLAVGAAWADTTPVASVAASGPTPYPKDAKDWPGKGAIRVFGWMNDNRKSFWLDRDRQQGRVVFAGDSLVGGWSTMAKDLPNIPVANRGIGSDVSRGLLFRFTEDVLDLHPKAIVLLTGTNDLSAQQDIQQTRSNIIEMIGLAERAAPGVPIVLCTLPPRDHPQAPVDPKRLIELNKLIASLDRTNPHVAVLDLYSLLVDPDGSPHPDYFAPDKLHLSAAGYRRFRDALLPLLKQLNVG
jgi:lysophospholipase L1-like esterase